MFHSLLAAPTPQVSQGYSVTNNTLYSRVSTGVAATDSVLQYMGHVDIPAGALSGLSTDWRARISCLYESGTFDGVSADNQPTATTSLIRRFHIRIGTIDGSDPTNINNTVAMVAPAETTAARGGQFSAVFAAVAGSGGNDVRVSAMYGTQGEYLNSTNALNHWYDQFSSSGLRLAIFFAWEAPYAANTIIKVVSTAVEVIPGKSTTLVTSAAPRTLTAAMFGASWNRWPKTTTAGVVPLGVTYGCARSWNYDGKNGVSGDADSAFNMNAIETVDWLTLTSAQRQASASWSCLDYFVAQHAGKRRIITVSYPSKIHSATGALNTPPVDLANNTTGSWYIFCNELGKRYAGQGHYYEIFNEPYTVAGTGPFTNFGSPMSTYVGFTGTAAQLSQMVVQAATAIRAADPSAKIIGPSFVTPVNRGAATGADYIRAALSTNSNAMINAVDYIGYHCYPININAANPSPLAAYGFTRNIRNILTELGFASKPLYMTEMTTENPFYPNLETGARLAYLQRSVITLLLGDAYQQGVVWYGLDGLTDYFVQADADAWNAMVSFMTSGPITGCTINQDGTVSVVVGTASRTY